MTDILNLVKSRKTTREYNNKVISDDILNKILLAGIWGPSLLNKQPGKFLVIKNYKTRKKIYSMVNRRNQKLGLSGRVIFFPTTLTALRNAQILIAIYNTGDFKKSLDKFILLAAKHRTQVDLYKKIVEQAEISAISAAIQNMILQIEALGLGSCWLHMPLFCEKEINVLLKTNNRLVAILALGYSKSKVSRCERQSFSEIVKII